MYGIPGNPTNRNQSYGFYLRGTDDVVSRNTVYDHANTGIFVQGARTRVSGNMVYGNATGIYTAFSGSLTDQIVVGNNTVHDNTSTGILGFNTFLISGNTVYGQSANGAAGISANYGGEVAGNVVYTNYNGIVGNSTTIDHNRVFNAAHFGISAVYNSPIEANQVYSNGVGIQLGNSYRGLVDDNLVYANTNQSILVQENSSDPIEIVNNTVYQPVGDAVRLDSNSHNVTLRNNILWVLAGYDVYVAADSQAGFGSDYNLLYKGTDVNAHIGYWNGIQDTLAAWKAAARQDPNSVSADPGFVDAPGADNVLGYAQVGGSYRDGGLDDNFYLAKNSPAVDAGDSWPAPAADIEGLPRRDDPGTANAGAPDYFGTVQDTSLFTAGGTAKGWRTTGGAFNLSLPFNFPFYGTSYNAVWVSTSGFLQFGDSSNAGDRNNSTAALIPYRRIAPLWANLSTANPGDDIFVDTSVTGQVTIRWKATNLADNSDVNFAVVLFGDGRFRFDYGAGNTNLTPTVGIAFGNSRAYRLVTGYDGQATLTNAASVLFGLQPGYVDIGAYEFRGDSRTTTPPTVTGTTPPVIHAGGTTQQAITQIQVAFSEEVNPIDANAPAVYELRKAGSGGFGSPDDVVYSLTPRYNVGGTVVSIAIAGLPPTGLPPGLYRFTIFSSTTTSIHDLAGLRLDGTGSGTEGGNYVRVFTVQQPAAQLTLSGFVSPAVAGTAGAITVRALDGSGNIYPAYRGTVHFTSSDGQAGLPADYTFTAADAGVHTFMVTLKTAGVQSITATDTVTPSLTATQGNITITPAAASTLVVAGFPASVTAGTPGMVMVTAKDAYGNVATGYTGTVTLTSTDAQAGLPAPYTFTAADAGTHAFSVTLKTAGTQTLTASDDGGFTAGQSGITVTPAAAVSLQVSGFPSPVVAGTAGTVTITALDAYGNVATGYTGTVSFTSTDPQAVLPDPYTFSAADAGVQTFSVTLATAGLQSIAAADDGGLGASQDAIEVDPGAAVTFQVSGFPTPVVAGTPGMITVTALDAYGNVATGYTGTVHLTSTDPQASLDPDYTFMASDAGMAVFNVTLYTAGMQAITATDTSDATITGTQAGIEVDPAAADHFLITAPAGATSGVPFDVTVTALDPYGNVDVNYTGTVSWTTSDGDPGVVLPPDYTFTAADAGVHTFAQGFTLVTPGDQTLTATDLNGPTGMATVTVSSGPDTSATRRRTREITAGAVPAPAALGTPASGAPNGRHPTADAPALRFAPGRSDNQLVPRASVSQERIIDVIFSEPDGDLLPGVVPDDPFAAWGSPARRRRA